MQLRTDSSGDLRDGVRETDIEAVREIVASTGFFHDFEVEVAAELVEERLKRGFKSEYYFLFADDAAGRTIGYACFGPIPCTQGSFDLYWIAVHQEAQGRGLGRRLMGAAEAAMQGDLPAGDGSTLPRARRVYIETSSQTRYEPTQAFYRRCGYALEARLKDYYAPGDDKLVYVKALA